MSLLIDEVSQPTVRQHIGRLLSTCTTADIAVGHIRLAALDLAGSEIERVQQCRILVGRLEARALTDIGDVVNGARSVDDAAARAPIEHRMRTLLEFLESGRVQIRSAGLGAWSPDFSVYHGVPDGDVCLLGAHYFRESPSTHGPSFTALLKDPHCIVMVGARFDALWDRSHDVLEPIVSAVHRARSCHPA